MVLRTVRKEKGRVMVVGGWGVGWWGGGTLSCMVTRASLYCCDNISW